MNNRERAPLVEAINQYLRQDYLSFHMPGHKGGRGAGEDFRHLIEDHAMQADLTELDGLDDLHNPTGPIREAQELAASLMGAGRAKFLVNGVTAGITAAILSLCRPGDKIIIPRHAHRSIYGALTLAGASPVYLKPHLHPGTGFPLGLDAAETDQLLKMHRDAKALVMVHPTYHGFTSDLGTIVNAAGAMGIPVLTDEAHGPHFKFDSRFPPDALSSGAAITVQGWHKTMGSLTQSAMLLLNDHTADGYSLGIDQYLMILQSTSPSYLLMASLDGARQNWACQGEQMAAEMLDQAFLFRREAGKLKGISCLDRETIEGTPAKAFDPTKLVIAGGKIGLNGFQLARELRERYGIEAEMAEAGGVTLMLTIGDRRKNLDSLLGSLKDLDQRYAGNKPSVDIPLFCFPLPKIIILPGQAVGQKKRAVPISAASGEIAAEYICPYPPGIPLVVPGEMITKEIILAAGQILDWGGRFQGPADGTLKQVQVIDS